MSRFSVKTGSRLQKQEWKSLVLNIVHTENKTPRKFIYLSKQKEINQNLGMIRIVGHFVDY